MAVPLRLVPLLEQYEFARRRLTDRLSGPSVDSGNGLDIEVVPITDEEYLWEPVANCWSVRRRRSESSPDDWRLDSAPHPHPWPPPLTTIAWRLGHLSEMLTLRADYTIGDRSLTWDDFPCHGDAASGVAAFEAGAAAWRETLVSSNEAALDMVGRCTYPYGSDPEDVFIDTVWWMNQELLHHGAEIALLRDLYAHSRGQPPQR